MVGSSLWTVSVVTYEGRVETLATLYPSLSLPSVSLSSLPPSLSWFWHSCSTDTDLAHEEKVLYWYSLLDGPWSGCSREKRRLQSAVWHMGSGHHRCGVSRDPAPHVRSSPHEVRVVSIWCSGCGSHLMGVVKSTGRDAAIKCLIFTHTVRDCQYAVVGVVYM